MKFDLLTNQTKEVFCISIAAIDYVPEVLSAASTGAFLAAGVARYCIRREHLGENHNCKV